MRHENSRSSGWARWPLASAAALLLTLAAAQPSLADPPDGVITAKANAALAISERVDADEIDVDTEDGVVTLQGTVDSEAERQAAVSLVSDIEGVEAINDELAVEHPALASASDLDDEYYTTRQSEMTTYSWSDDDEPTTEATVELRSDTSGSQVSRWTARGYEVMDPPSDSSREFEPGEQELMEDVNDALAGEESLEGTSIQAVSAAGDVVLLSGTADNLDQELEAIEVAQSVRGVDGVMSEVFTLDVDEDRR